MDAKFYSFKRFNNVFLLIIFIVVAFSILYNSYANESGYISPDSSNYLRLVQNLLDGDGFYVPSTRGYQGLPNGDSSSVGYSYFSTWPMGYPLLIYFFASVMKLNVFLSSKIVNILFLALTLMLINKIFRDRSWMYASIFLTPSAIAIFSFTWSEVPFLFGLLWFTYALYISLAKSEIWTNYVSLVCASIFLFLMRYIGAFSVIAMFGVTIYKLVKKHNKKALTYSILSLFLASVVMGTYLLVNLYKSGTMTGVRHPPYEHFSELLRMTIIAGINELNFFTLSVSSPKTSIIGFSFFVVTSLIQLFFLIFVFRKTKLVQHIWLCNPKGLTFLFVGLLYYLAITGMRWTAHFDALGYRLLFPGTFLIYMSALCLVDNQSFDVLSQKRIHLSVLIIASLLLFSPYGAAKPVWSTILGRNTTSNYLKTIEKLEEVLAAIPENSAVVFPDNHMRYLRKDLLYLVPDRYRSTSSPETMDQFLDKLVMYPMPVYLYINENYLQSKDYSDSIITFLNNHEVGTVVRLK